MFAGLTGGRQCVQCLCVARKDTASGLRVDFVGISRFTSSGRDLIRMTRQKPVSAGKPTDQQGQAQINSRFVLLFIDHQHVRCDAPLKHNR